MRLHQLTITAFGPFAGTVEIDFDELSAGGLFLLTGATGAGKTSVLDAVCFALYGQVPGDRAGAKHLRSDHASPQSAPEVTLRFSVAERQFVFSRSPAWSRPKLRGTGETRVQAHVLVTELKDGAWVTLSNRLDDAGLLVTDLLGMTCTQFTQVAMLPQGRFQAFLRASSTERHAVLQQLFRTDRFERVERWLVERRTTARRASESAGAEVLAVVNRLREAAVDLQAPAWEDDLVTSVENGRLQDWLVDLTAATSERAAFSRTAAEHADAQLVAAIDVLTRARREHEHHLRADAARADLARLTGQAEARAVAAARLADHHRAAPLSALVAGLERAVLAVAESSAGWATHQVQVGEHDDLARALRDARAAHTRALAFAPRADARRLAGTAIATSRSRLQALETRVAEIDVAIAAQPAVIADAVAAVHEARAAAARLPVVVATVESCEDLVAAARRAELVGLELAAARTDVLTATEMAQASKEHYLDVREARINGMAGELAGQLASGCSCPVCGSADHPAPARSDLLGVGRAQEDEARRLSEDAAFELQTRKVGLATLTGELAGLDERLAGVDRDALPGRLAQARADVERLEPLVATLDFLVGREQECRTRLRDAEDERAAALLERAALRVDVDQNTTALELIDAEWVELLRVDGATGAERADGDLDELVARRAAQVATLAAAVAAAETLDRAQEQEALARTGLERAATEAGFADPASAIAALLPEATSTDLAARLRDAELTEHAARLTLEDPAVTALGAVPDLDGLGAVQAAAAATARTASSARDAAAARALRVSELVADLDRDLGRWAPLREEHRIVSGLASLVEGKSVDNPLRMRLAAYVLAERLRQVVAAANERLARMTDQRYALEHSDDRGYGEQRGGLSLRVRDDWNGVQRDPATLSGGETFVVSLALALGLADTVAHEAGGTDIDTLFIDEGFGSLDADTLEDVMDTLDSLRDGGRVVGLVSHVPELRSRITTQLEVSKGRNGSTVRAAFTGS